MTPAGPDSHQPSRAKQSAWAAKPVPTGCSTGVRTLRMEIHPVQCNEFDLCGVMPAIVAWMVRGFYWLCRGWLVWPFPSLHLPSSSLFAATVRRRRRLRLHLRLAGCLCLVPLFPVASGLNRLFFSPSPSLLCGLFLRRLGTCPHPVHTVVVPSVPYGNPVVSRSSGFLAPSAAIVPSTRTCRPSLLPVVDVVLVKHTPT